MIGIILKISVLMNVVKLEFPKKEDKETEIRKVEQIAVNLFYFGSGK